MERTNVIDMQGIVKRYYEGEPNELEILHGIDLKVFQGEFVSIVGESGSGKSTLMNMIGALDRPTEGQYFLGGRDISKLQDEELSDIRNQEIGFVFQNFCLIPRMSAVRNVEIPLMYANMPPKQRRERAMELLALVGMEERADHKPNELSGGQNQRVAIARAMANDPHILLADEPTGALDSKTGHLVMDIFHRLHEEQDKTIVLITHSQELAHETERMITISDGRIIADKELGGEME
ncbi:MULTISPECIES: ABC transporter ATP-binding protein [Roseburia]|jgi:putative ABC transport system ATP-binding protein|nr:MULTISPECIES: ABC transporter ATP-binding protein [Roseburia]